ncbi:3'-5' ssDNA/RNA exonuclease TatD-like [Lytechinus pictus]|uniref:3'-5' ssDNA/RNA exonuclease TatD-like n=1 Tax=Lytechinus pictus TaxID=7653 RepID=UPI0030BA10EB
MAQTNVPIETEELILLASSGEEMEEQEGPHQEEEAPHQEEEAPHQASQADTYDTHFHPDRIQSKREELGEPGKQPEQPVDLVGGVLNYCDPENYTSPDFVNELVRLQEGRNTWKIAMGIHPKQASTFTERHWQALLRHLDNPRVIGLSEVGFEFTMSPEEWPNQERLFNALLDVGTRGRVLILHLRGVEDGTSVHVISRRLIRKKCPKGQRIHLHSFNGTVAQMRAWTTEFPNCFLGLSGLTRWFSDHQRTMVREIPEGRLLLETDAPYLPPRPGMRFNEPKFLGDVGRLVAGLRDIPLARLMAVTTANAQRLYCS